MKFGESTPAAYARIGTTPPIYIARGLEPRAVKPGEYFWIKIHSAQAAFRGSIFEQAQQLVVTSKVNLNHPALGNEEVFAVQRSRAVKKNRAEQLGLSPNLVSLVPATMSRVSVSVEYLLDKKNHLAQVGALINSDSFIAAVSLAPGAVAVAKTIGGLAQKVIQTFIPAEERSPILQFAGDFNLGGEAEGGGMREGYYAILGTRHEETPLPDPRPKLELREDTLLADGQAVTHFSYVVLEVAGTPVRTRALNEGAAWDRKLRDAENLAQEVADDPFADDGEKRDKWAKCKTLLQEARALLMADANYAPQEAAGIYKTAYKWCADTIAGKATTEALAKGAARTFDSGAERAAVGLDVEEDLESAVAEYAAQVEEAERILKANQFL